MKFRTLLSLCAAGSLSLLTACASTEPAQDMSDFDPIEPVNRVVHGVNGAVDFMVLYPAAMWRHRTGTCQNLGLKLRAQPQR